MYYALAEGVIVRERITAFPQPFDCVAISASNEDYGLSRELALLLGSLDGTRSVESIASEWGDTAGRVLQQLRLAGILAATAEPSCNAMHALQYRSVAGLAASCRAAIWHLTRRCNLACSHCYYLYQPENVNDFTTEQIRGIANNLLELGVEYVTVTGGEVLANLPTFRFLADALSQRCLPFGINTNGTYDVEHVLGARSPYLRLVQSSIDGPSVEHDSQRGVTGSHDRTMSFLDRLAAAGVFTRVVSMLTPAWMTPDRVLEVANDLSARGVRDWLIEIPSKTGRWHDAAAESDRRALVEIGTALYAFCEKGAHSFKRVALNQVFEWPLAKKVAKLKSDAVCSHDLGLLSFGTEGVSYCTLFREQFGAGWKDMGSAAGDLRGLWNAIAEFRTRHTIADNPTCASCEIFEWCQGGCPGHYANPAQLSGCDRHSRLLAFVKQDLFTEGVLPAAFAPVNALPREQTQSPVRSCAC